MANDEQVQITIAPIIEDLDYVVDILLLTTASLRVMQVKAKGFEAYGIESIADKLIDCIALINKNIFRGKTRKGI